MRELLAERVHETWRKWMDYVLSKAMINPSGSAMLDAEYVRYWQDRMAKQYADLSDDEKREPREEADQTLRQIHLREPNLGDMTVRRLIIAGAPGSGKTRRSMQAMVRLCTLFNRFRCVYVVPIPQQHYMTQLMFDMVAPLTWVGRYWSQRKVRWSSGSELAVVGLGHWRDYCLGTTPNWIHFDLNERPSEGDLDLALARIAHFQGRVSYTLDDAPSGWETYHCGDHSN